MPMTLSRRLLMRNMLGAAAAGALRNPMRAAWLQQPRGEERGNIGRIAAAFKQQYRVPALSVAFSKNGQFVYNQAFGMADREQSQPLARDAPAPPGSLSRAQAA